MLVHSFTYIAKHTQGHTVFSFCMSIQQASIYFERQWQRHGWSLSVLLRQACGVALQSNSCMAIFSPLVAGENWVQIRDLSLLSLFPAMSSFLWLQGVQWPAGRCPVASVHMWCPLEYDHPASGAHVPELQTVLAEKEMCALGTAFLRHSSVVTLKAFAHWVRWFIFLFFVKIHSARKKWGCQAVRMIFWFCHLSKKEKENTGFIRF